MAESDTPRGSLPETVRRERERRERWRREGERPLSRNLAMMGALGWLLAVPTLLGLLLGRWLDHVARTGVMFTATGIFLGVILGARLVWQRMNEP